MSYVWTRQCPCCDRRLEKARPYQFFRCEAPQGCGWDENQPSRDHVAARFVMALVVGLLVSGCASLPDTVKALAKDDATVCIMVDATMYGRATICRTNAGAADINVKGDEMTIQHRGR